MRRREFTPNDTRGVIRILSLRYAGTARGRNRILLATVILCIVALTMVFGITRGKIRAEELNAIRTAGTAASGVVEDGNASQYAALKAAGYIRQAGRCVTVGPAETEETVCSIRWADADAWEKLLCPAYTEVHGNYPEQKQEIMLSGRALKTLGITDPEEGMEIVLRVYYGLFQNSEETFRLSGWFTDHGGETVPGYVSEKKLSDWGIRPDEEADLIFRQADRLDWQETETRLYEDLQMSDPGQKITVSDTAAHQAVSGMTGGYGMAALGTVIVLCGIFFLCHNVLQISMAGDIRQLGLLNTIGATQKQLSKVYYSQIRRILIPGSVAGVALSAVLLAGIIPLVLGGEYLEKTGGTEGLHIFHPGILLLAQKKQKEMQEETQRSRQLLRDYPEIVGKLTLYLGAGMTVKRAFRKVVEDYERQKETTGVRCAYEEMQKTLREMESGHTEAESYENFGRRCKVQAYLRFGALLSQNLRKGTRGLTQLLKMESIQAFEDRKARARRLGEEAGTKLLLPMFLMLAVVLVIVIVPAFLSMQIL